MIRHRLIEDFSCNPRARAAKHARYRSPPISIPRATAVVALINQQEIAMSSVNTAKNRLTSVVALMLVSALSGCATIGETAGKCQSNQCSSDAMITSDVQTHFQQHPEFGANELHVQTIGNVVYLNGTVSVGEQRADAEGVARQTPGVTQIVDNIAIAK
jgi:osmotically-inducible protein OsmY